MRRAGTRHCLQIPLDVAARSQTELRNQRLKAAFDSAVIYVQERKVVVYLDTPMTKESCSQGLGRVLLAFVLPEEYPFKPPKVWLLTKGMFLPYPRYRGFVPLWEAPMLYSWSPAYTLALLTAEVMQQLASSEPLVTCTPSTVEETLRARPAWELKRMQRQWKVWAERRFSSDVVKVIEVFLGDLATIFKTA